MKGLYSFKKTYISLNEKIQIEVVYYQGKIHWVFLRVLPLTSHKTSSFRYGTEIYSGEDFDFAWGYIKDQIPNVTISQYFKRIWNLKSD